MDDAERELEEYGIRLWAAQEKDYLETIERLKAERAELLAALRGVVAMYGPSSDYGHEARAVWEQAEAAIAKAEGR